MAGSSLSRRGVLIGAVGSAGSVGACSQLGAFGGATAQAAASETHEHHGHEGHEMSPPAAVDNTVLHALLHCRAASEACLTHCLNMLGSGDGSLAACAARVRDTMAVCDASITLVSAGSPLTGDMLEVCKSACEMCKAECDKHAGHHQTCADCAKSCEDVIAAIGA